MQELSASEYLDGAMNVYMVMNEMLHFIQNLLDID